MRDLGMITRVGPITGGPWKGPTTTIPPRVPRILRYAISCGFRIEVETIYGPAVLTLSPSAAAELREELSRYLQRTVPRKAERPKRKP